MTLFTLPVYESFGRALHTRLGGRVKEGRVSVRRFPNGEMHISAETPVRGETCAVIGCTAPPDENLLALLLLAHTLKKEGANKVVAVVPYLGYSRQDKDERGESRAIEWLGSAMKASGIDSVVTLDLHSREDAALFPLPLIDVSPAPALAAALRTRPFGGASFIAPDEGARARCERLKRELGGKGEITYFTKRREEKGVTSELCGEIRPSVVIVDDILDTGTTLIAALEKLSACGVRSAAVAVTHALFTGSEWRKLWALGVEALYCTDSVPPSLRSGGSGQASVVPAAGLLAEAVLKEAPGEA